MSINKKISLSKELESFRCDRPDEWKMDDFIEKALKLEAERDMLNGFVLELLSLIYNSAEGEICMGYTADIEGIARSAFSITSLDSPMVREALRNERRKSGDQ